MVDLASLAPWFYLIGVIASAAWLLGRYHEYTEGDKSACTKCLDDRPHPWHDDGTQNDDPRYVPAGPMSPPRHLPDDSDG